MLLCMLVLPAMLIACGNLPNQSEEIDPTPEFLPYVSGYSGGIQSIHTPITIELANIYPDATPGQMIKQNLFSFKPSIDGKAVWLDEKTIQFTPSGFLDPSTQYIVNFHLGELYDVSRDLQHFEFSFRTLKADAKLSFIDYIQPKADDKKVSLTFKLELSDAYDMAKLNEAIKISSSTGDKLAFEINSTSPNSYNIIIDDIERQKEPNEINLSIDGPLVGLPEKLNSSFVVPSVSDFEVLYADKHRSNSSKDIDGYKVVFSESLDPNQAFNSFVILNNHEHFASRVVDNQLFIYSDNNKLDSVKLQIFPHLTSINGKKLDQKSTIVVQSDLITPKVNITSKGSILPDSKEQVISFTAQALEYVDIQVVKVYTNNVLEFYRDASLIRESMLKRAGRLILKNRINLKDLASKPLNEEQTFSLDLAPLFKQEPGALYYIALSFKPEYTTLPEFAKERAKLGLTQVNENLEFKESSWDSPFDSYDLLRFSLPYVWSAYDWKRVKDPTHVTFYMNDVNVSSTTSVYSSSIGLTLKQNDGNKLWVAVNDMLTTKPIMRARVKVYSYQLQLLAELYTDKNGFAEISHKGVPFLVVAEYDQDKTYLRVAKGEQLTTSRFDVGGVIPENGMKGFVYGERGVWRPGDDIHLTFVLEDRAGRLPKNHPVSLELFNPKGQFYTKVLATSHENGMYYFKLKTQQDDPTGTWNAYVHLGGSTFHKALMVETIKPNRLKVNLDIEQPVLFTGKYAPAKLSSNWLMGELASDLNAKIEMTLSDFRSAFPDYDNYLFTNLSQKFKPITKTSLFDGKLNSMGEVNLSLSIPAVSNAPGMLKAQITTRVYEPGGDFSIYTQSIPVSPYSSYVGMALDNKNSDYIETDSPIVFNLISLDAQGKPLSGKNLSYEVYKLGWSWWYDQENLWTKYINNMSVTPLHKGSLKSDAQGKASFSFQENYPDYGSFLVYVRDVDSGHAVSQTVYVDWPSWRGRASRSNPGGSTYLSFSLDKAKYEVGDMVEVTLPNSSNGRALVTIENGSDILMHEWVEVHEGIDTKYRFKTTKEMSPNAYVFVSLLQPHAQTVNDLPIRMYGVEPLIVNDESTRLTPKLEIPKVVEPEKTFTVKVSEQHKKQMTYTLAIVDDGLLDLTSFKTPNPWSYFYSKEALGIQTWDMYDEVIGALGAVYSQKYRVGGDEVLNATEPKANRFNPIVKFYGPFTLQAGKTDKHEITLPMYVGSVRAMVVASDGSAFGSAEENTIVRSPLMIIPSLPRVLSIGDEVLVPINVFAMDESAKKVQVKLSSSANVKVDGASSQTLNFEQTGDKIVYFKLKVGSKTGVEKIKIEAQSNAFKATEEIEIDVRNPNPIYTKVDDVVLTQNQTKQFDFYNATNGAVLKSNLEISRLPAVNLTSRFQYLSSYQHSCTEQIVSKALPLLYVEFLQTIDKDTQSLNKQTIQRTIQELYSRQLSDGSFAYWPNESSSNPWSTAYAGFFLTKAKEMGYQVNANVLSRWSGYLLKVVRMWNPSNANWTYSNYMQAYNLYVLAVANQADLPAMNRLKEFEGMDTQSRWLLASAYAIIGKKDIANKLVFNVKANLNSYYASYYGSQIRDVAFMLQALVALGQDGKAFDMAKKLSTLLNDQTYYQTQSTAMGIIALADYARGMKHQGMDFSIRIGSDKPEDIKSVLPLYSHSTLGIETDKKIEVKNNISDVLHAQFVQIIQLYNDTLPAIQDKGLMMNVAYTDLLGNKLDIKNLSVGQDLLANITLSNPTLESYQDIALTHIIPASWEVYQVVGEPRANSQTNVSLRYQDVRDDRILSYFDLPAQRIIRLKVRLHVTYAGEYTLPAIQASLMYDPEIFSRTKAETIIVER